MWEWGWQDCQFLPTRTLHQQWNLTLGKGSELYRLSTLSTMVLKGKNAPALPTRGSPLSVHPHTRTIVCSFFSHTCFFPIWSHASRREEPSPLSFTFSTERNLACFDHTRFCVVFTQQASWEPCSFTHDFPL